MADPIESITHARVMKIALPIVLSNATIPILGAVDTGVVGQMGQAAPIGAVGVGAGILIAVYWIFGFLRMGTSGLVAQALGAGDRSETGAVLVRALLIAAVAGVAFILLQGPLTRAALALAPASAEVEALAHTYIAIRIWGAPATIALYAVTGWLIAIERTRAVLLLQLCINGVNVILDVWFVLGLGLGVPGVAFATLIAEWTGLALGLWLCREAFAVPGWNASALIFDPARLRRMIAVNTDIMIRSVLLQASFTAFVFLGAGLGDAQLAANQVLLQFLAIIAFALDGFAFAAESLVGQAVGAGAPDRVRQAALASSRLGVMGAVLLALGFVALGPAIIDTMTTSAEVRAEARQFLPWVVAAPLIGIAAWMFDGIYIGATLTREMRNLMLLSTVIYAIAVALLLPAFGNHGLWAALTILNVTRGIVMALYYPRAEARAALAL